MNFKFFLVKLNWFFSSQLGINISLIYLSVFRLPRYLYDFVIFRNLYLGKIHLSPCLHDKHQQSGSTSNEYFWQDLLVARLIYNSKPINHVDVGSRIDGFVAHLATFMECEVFDIRINDSKINGITFSQVDIMNSESLPDLFEGGYCDSISSLHALEHFGLGRYGDTLNLDGYKKGISNMSKLLRFNGLLYLSTPVGCERVEFNANWIFNPYKILNECQINGLHLINLFSINSSFEPTLLEINSHTFDSLANCHYQLILFVFKKVS